MTGYQDGDAELDILQRSQKGKGAYLATYVVFLDIDKRGALGLKHDRFKLLH